MAIDETRVSDCRRRRELVRPRRDPDMLSRYALAGRRPPGRPPGLAEDLIAKCGVVEGRFARAGSLCTPPPGHIHDLQDVAQLLNDLDHQEPLAPHVSKRPRVLGEPVQDIEFTPRSRTLCGQAMRCLKSPRRIGPSETCHTPLPQ